MDAGRAVADLVSVTAQLPALASSVVCADDLPDGLVVAGLRAAGLRVLAADGNSRQSLDQVEPRGVLSEPTAWLFGNEAWGLPADILALADERVAVPIYGQAESLNLAAAAAVCLYASARAQRINDEGGCRAAPAAR